MKAANKLDEERSYQAFSADTVRLLIGIPSSAIGSEREPTVFPVHQVESMRDVFVLARHTTRTIRVLHGSGNLHSQTRQTPHPFLILRANRRGVLESRFQPAASLKRRFLANKL